MPIVCLAYWSRDWFRSNLEELVYSALQGNYPAISISKGREILGFRYMEEMREWRDKYENTQKEI